MPDAWAIVGLVPLNRAVRLNTVVVIGRGQIASDQNRLICRDILVDLRINVR